MPSGPSQIKGPSCSSRWWPKSYERQSLIITTNLKFSQWPQVFASEQLTGALLDRFTHQAHILAMTGEGFRFRESLRNMRFE